MSDNLHPTEAPKTPSTDGAAQRPVRIHLRAWRRYARAAWPVKIAVPILILSAFAAGTYHGFWIKTTRHPEFHDIVVNHVPDYLALVDPHHPAVEELARSLGTEQKAYEYVRDKIRFVPSRAAGSPDETIRSGEASCLGKATLLVSLYRALGIPPERVHVVTGEVMTPSFLAEHAWVEVEHDGSSMQQDPTDLLGKHAWDQFPGNEYTTSFVRREGFCFNDQGLGLVSQLNRMPGAVPPP